MRRTFGFLLAVGAALASVSVPGSPDLPLGASPAMAAEGPVSAASGNRPAGEQFVVLNDGRFFPGKISRDKEKRTITVETAGGAQTFPYAEISVAIKPNKEGDGIIQWARSDDLGMYLAWKAWLDKNHLAKRGGKKFDTSEKADADRYRVDLIAAVEQCTAWRTYSAAGALLGDALDLDAWSSEVQEAAVASVPDVDSDQMFPFTPEDAVKAKLWARWSKAIIPFGGQFVNPATHPRKSEINRSWLQDTVIMRTRNIELWSKERENLEVVCDVLRQAESTVRALEALLGKPELGNDEPMMVRLCTNRAKYLEDIGPGGRPPDWSGGFFSPGDGISRFYIDFRGEMQSTVSHELTHHWLERRFFRGGDSNSIQPGYWIVEGFARYVEHQSGVFQKGKFGFDNENARSLQTCRGGGRRFLFPSSTLIDLSQRDFGNVITGDDTKLQMFYEQSGAMVFFLMNKAGPEVRKNLIGYMRKYYMGELIDTGPPDPLGQRKIDIEKGKPVKEGWKLLGYETAGKLDAAFQDYLTSSSKK